MHDYCVYHQLKLVCITQFNLSSSVSDFHYPDVRQGQTVTYAIVFIYSN